jgi:hypothetical protein
MSRYSQAQGLWPRHGAVVAWLVVCMSVIVGIVALVLDGGRMMQERRTAQMLCDTATLAAANDLYANYTLNQGRDPSGSALAAALASVAANGGGNATVTVNIPPQAGAFAGQAECVEVIVQSNLCGTFSSMFTQGPLSVQFRSVARGRPLNIGLTLLQTYGTNLSVDCNCSVTVVNAPIVANSSGCQVFSLGDNASVSAQFHNVAGSPCQSPNILGPVNTNVAALADPLAALTPPSPANYPLQQVTSAWGTNLLATATTDALTGIASPVGTGSTLQPGVYNGGISVTGNTSLTLAPGVYILNGGGLQVADNASLTGSGVVFYNTGGCGAGPIGITGNGSVTLTPPTSGPYQGISIFQERGVSQTINLASTGNIQVIGLVYAPNASAHITLGGAAGNIMGGGYVVNDLQVSGNGTCTIDHGTIRPRVPQIGLVE